MTTMGIHDMGRLVGEGERASKYRVRRNRIFKGEILTPAEDKTPLHGWVTRREGNEFKGIRIKKEALGLRKESAIPKNDLKMSQRTECRMNWRLLNLMNSLGSANLALDLLACPAGRIYRSWLEIAVSP